MNCEYVRQHYGVPACIGRKVTAYGKPGVIMADRGHYIGVALVDSKKITIDNYHPTHEIVYGDMAEKLPSLPKRSKYDDFMEADTGLYFHEFLGITRPTTHCIRHQNKWQYRMSRNDYSFEGTASISGEWCDTKKAAKESYKKALAARKY